MKRVLDNPPSGDWSKAIMALVDEGPDLRELVIGTATRLPPPKALLGDLTDLVFSFPDLESLTVCGRGAELEELPLENLKALHWRAWAGTDITTLLGDVPRLETLELWSGPSGNTHKLIGPLDRLKKLTSLAIRYRMADEWYLSVPLLEALAESRVLVELERLELTDQGLSEDDIEILLADPEPWQDMRLVLDRNALPDFTVRLLSKTFDLSAADQRPSDADYEEIKE